MRVQVEEGAMILSRSFQGPLARRAFAPLAVLCAAFFLGALVAPAPASAGAVPAAAARSAGALDDARPGLMQKAYYYRRAYRPRYGYYRRPYYRPYYARPYYARPAYGPRVVCRVQATYYGPRRVCVRRW
jgi:hypothetical protein